MRCLCVYCCRCLQENKGQKEFGKACLKEITSYEQKSSQDYRFNFRLASQCKADIKSLCSGICKPEQGQVRHCGRCSVRQCFGCASLCAVWLLAVHVCAVRVALATRQGVLQGVQVVNSNI